MTIVPPMLADFYPLKDRNLAYTVFWVCAPVGGALGFTVGALLGPDHSWRTALMAVGLPGLLVACYIPCINDPARGVNDPAAFLDRDGCSSESDQHDQCMSSSAGGISLLKCFGEILSVPHWICAVLGSTACSFVVGGLSDWGDTLMVRTFPQEGIKNVGITLGVTTAISGVMGPIVGFAVVERVQIRYHNAALLVSSLFMIPAAGFLCVAINVASSKHAVYLALLLGWMCLFAHTAVLAAFMVNVIPVRLRAMSGAMSTILSHMLGDIISPPIIGAISDSTGSLRAGMQLVWIMACVASCIWMAGWLTLSALPGCETAEASVGKSTQKGASLHSLFCSDDCDGEADMLGCTGNSYSSNVHAANSERIGL